MTNKVRRRQFLQTAAVGGAAGIGAWTNLSAAPAPSALVSPGCRGTKVRVAKIYLGKRDAHWPSPRMDVDAEAARYQLEFARMQKEFADVEFVESALVTTKDQAAALKPKLQDVDGVLAIHLSMASIMPALREILSAGKPTVLFAAPYSGHEWTGFGPLRQEPAGALLECMLTSDLSQLAAAVRPFRAIHHLREAKILNVTARDMSADYLKAIKEKFGTEFVKIGKERVIDAYEAIADADAKEETDRWISQAEKIVEPTHEEIFKACKLALALEKIVNEERATGITSDCYGTMYRQLPAFQCIGFTRLNDMGLAGICESDLRCAMTHILFQGLSGRPGFISDPTVDESCKGIVLAHCLGTRKMDGPDGRACPYRIRTVQERQEGVVAQVRMDVGRKVTQAILIGVDLILYFTGEIIAVPDVDRGCRTQITVKVDGDLEKLWQNWSNGLHRVTCYGDLTADLKRFCRFKGIALTCEA